MKRLVIPAWDVQRGAVHIFKTPHHMRLARDWRIPMVDIAMATSAAPLYFPAARVDGHRLIDGGVWANNPSVVAIAEAVSMLGCTAELHPGAQRGHHRPAHGPSQAPRPRRTAPMGEADHAPHPQRRKPWRAGHR